MPLKFHENDQPDSLDTNYMSRVFLLPTTAGPGGTHHRRHPTMTPQTRCSLQEVKSPKRRFHQSNDAKCTSIVEPARRVSIFTRRQDVEEGRGVKTPQ